MLAYIQTLFSVIDETAVDPTTPLDWGIIGLVVVGLVTSVGQAMKKLIEWVVDKITAPDTRMEELELEKAAREAADRTRLIQLETAVVDLRAELIAMHIELKQSEVARARTEGELAALKLQIQNNAKKLDTKESND